MRYALALFATLAIIWWSWSGHTEPFILGLGGVSCLVVVFCCARMGILDNETVPVWLGLRPFTRYAPWLVCKIIVANLDVAWRIVQRRMPIEPTMLTVHSTQRTELGRVILANSITLTPGTVSVDLQGQQIRVHALAQAAAAENGASEMDLRVSELEGRG